MFVANKIVLVVGASVTLGSCYSAFDDWAGAARSEAAMYEDACRAGSQAACDRARISRSEAVALEQCAREDKSTPFSRSDYCQQEFEARASCRVYSDGFVLCK